MKIFGLFTLVLSMAGSAQAAEFHCDAKGHIGDTEVTISADVKDDGTEEGLSAKMRMSMPQGVSEYPEEGEEKEKTASKSTWEGEKLAELFESLQAEHNSNQELQDYLEIVKTKNPDAKAPTIESTWTLIKDKEVESAVVYNIRPTDPMANIRSFTLKDKSVVNIFVADFVNPVVCQKPEEEK